MADSDLTPTAKVLRKANELKTTKDSTGRILKYRKLKPSDMLDLVAMIGTERSMNPIALSMSSATFKVVEIDGITRPSPITLDELKEVMDDLGDEGLQAMYETTREEDNKDKAPDKDKK